MENKKKRFKEGETRLISSAWFLNKNPDDKLILFLLSR